MPGLVVELLVAEQLEEAAERENRRPQLMGGVGDELPAGIVEPGEPQAHPVERPGELADLVAAVIHDRLLEVPGGDPLGRPLEPPDPAREDRRRGEPDDEGEREGDEAGPEEARANESDVLERRAERRREEQDVAGAVGDRRLGVGITAAADAAGLDAGKERRPEGDLVLGDILGNGQVGGVENGADDAERERGVVDDPGVGAPRSLIDEILADRPLIRLLRLLEHPAGGVGELGQLPVHEPALERRHERNPDDRERPEDDDRQREAQPRTDAPEGIHPRKR